jgi:hypothetical protein
MLDVTYVAQRTPNWCWAACFEMVRQCLGLAPRDQCGLVSDVYGGDCNDHIDQTALPAQVARDCGLRCVQVPLADEEGQLSLDDIRREIAERKCPVELQIADDHNGHVVLVVGCGPGDTLHIYDPDTAVRQTTVSLSELQTTGYRGKRWERSFYRFVADPESPYA